MCSSGRGVTKELSADKYCDDSERWVLGDGEEGCTDKVAGLCLLYVVCTHMLT